MIIAAILMNLSYSHKLKYNIEKEARKLGMKYPSEIKVMDPKEDKE